MSQLQRCYNRSLDDDKKYLRLRNKHDEILNGECHQVFCEDFDIPSDVTRLDLQISYKKRVPKSKEDVTQKRVIPEYVSHVVIRNRRDVDLLTLPTGLTSLKVWSYVPVKHFLHCKNLKHLGITVCTQEDINDFNKNISKLDSLECLSIYRSDYVDLSKLSKNLKGLYLFNEYQFAELEVCKTNEDLYLEEFTTDVHNVSFDCKLKCERASITGFIDEKSKIDFMGTIEYLRLVIKHLRRPVGLKICESGVENRIFGLENLNEE